MSDEDDPIFRYEAVKAVWQQLLEAQNTSGISDNQDADEIQWRSYKCDGASHEVVTPFKVFAAQTHTTDATLSLGHLIRFVVIRRLACPDVPFRVFRTRIEETPENEGKSSGTTSSGFREALNPFSKMTRQNEFPPNWKSAITAFVNSAIRPKHLRPLHASDIFEKAFTGQYAIRNFENYLTGREPHIQPFLEDQYFANDGEARSSMIQGVVREVFTASDGPKISNVYSQRMWVGLTALGGQLAQQITERFIAEDDERHCLYVPVHPTAQDLQLEPEAAGYQILLGRLWHFYCRDLSTIDRAEPIAPTDDIGLVLEDIKKCMLKRPRVLILDGVQVKHGSTLVSGIEKFIANDFVMDLLHTLLDPPLCHVTNGEELANWNQNRIIILSNDRTADTSRQTRLLKDWPHPGQTTSFTELEEPEAERVPAVLAGHDLPFLDDILRIRQEKRQLTGNWQDAEYHVLACLLTLCAANDIEIDPLLYRVRNRSEAFNDTTGLLEPLLVELIDILVEYAPLVARILYLVSSAPDGLRRATIQRLVRFSNLDSGKGSFISSGDIREYARARSIEEDTPHEVVVASAIDEMCDVLSPIMQSSGHDYYYGVDRVAHSVEFQIDPTWQSTDARSLRDTKTIVFARPILREVMRDTLVGAYEGADFHFCHRLLAEDALLQQTIALRHADTHETQQIYHLRRQISAIYHGLCSLPIVTDDRGKTARIRNHKQKSAFQALTPRRPRRYWRWLYLFAYRRMIEQPPIYAMSRVFGQDELKRDILVAFNRPWSLWPSAIRNKDIERAKSLFHGDLVSAHRSRESGQETPPSPRKLKMRRKVGQAFQFSLFQSHHILGEIEDMRDCLDSDLPLFTPSSVDLDLELSVLKRRLDFNGLLVKPIDDIPLSGLMVDNVLEAVMSAPGMAHVHDAIETSTIAYLERLLSRSSRHTVPVSFGAQATTFIDTIPEEMRTVGGLSSIADNLFRIAENHASHADYQDMERHQDQEQAIASFKDLKAELQTRKSGKSDDDYSFELCKVREITNEVDTVLAFCQAHALFSFAEEVRLLGYDRDPLSGKFFASGHAMRTMIRTGLKLEVLRRSILSGDGVTKHPLGPFGIRIRRDSDTMTRHLFRYPRERASQLVTEASILRILVFREEGLPALLSARELLARAETVTSLTSRRSRHTLRLALERAKLHRAISRFYLGSNLPDAQSAAEAFASLSHIDVRYVEKVAEKRQDTKIWKALARRQRARVSELFAELELSQP